MATETREVKTKVYSIGKDIGANDKCPPQAKLIVEMIKAAPDGKISRPDLLALLGKPPAEGGLVTRQTPDRILGFYRPKLIKDGVLIEEEVTSTIEVEVADKAPKAEGETAPVAEGEAAPAEQTKKSKHKGAEKVAA